VSAPAAQASAARVLLADDDPTMVLMLEHVLEGLGRVYDTAADGDEAWNAWDKTRHELVVLDIEMPKLDGLEVCRRIRAADPERTTFVLVLTGRDRQADVEAALDAGADDYVMKPVTGQHIVARMRIAQRRMATDAARREVEEQLRRARYLAGIGELTIALQHEINNPLTGLLGTAELMQGDMRDRGESTVDLEVIIEQARRIAALVKRMGEIREPKSVPYAGDARMVDLKE